MNPLDAVAVSMLPAWRTRVAAAFKEIHDRARRAGDAPPSGRALLDSILRSCGVPDNQVADSVSLALDRAAGAMGAAGDATPIPLDDVRYPVLLSCIPDPPPVIGSAASSRPLVGQLSRLWAPGQPRRTRGTSRFAWQEACQSEG
jgi:hypothetical protein